MGAAEVPRRAASLAPIDPRGLTGAYLTASGPASDPPEGGLALEMCATKRVPNLTGGSLEDIHHPFRAE